VIIVNIIIIILIKCRHNFHAIVLARVIVSHVLIYFQLLCLSKLYLNRELDEE